MSIGQRPVSMSWSQGQGQIRIGGWSAFDSKAILFQINTYAYIHIHIDIHILYLFINAF